MSGSAVRLVWQLSERAAQRPIPPAPIDTSIPDVEDDEPDDGHLGHAEGQSFVIQYVGADGVRSTRRITVWSIKRGAGGVPLLVARCHERKADRTFRVDRIRCCVDFDGEVHEDVGAFMRDTFGMAVANLSMSTPVPVGAQSWSSVRTDVLHHMTLLAALSHADAFMLPEELDVIVEWLEARARRAGLRSDGDFRRLARRYIARLRPAHDQIVAAVDTVCRDRPDDLVQFLAFGLRIIDADGLRHPDEVSLLNSFAEEMTGLPLL